MIKALFITFLVASFWFGYNSETKWRVTAYCSCEKCCGRFSDGYFASGKLCYVGAVANNWLPFGTKVVIDGITYVVEDRGSKKYFGTKKEKRKAIDIYFEDHQEAKNFGVQYLKVKVVK